MHRRPLLLLGATVWPVRPAHAFDAEAALRLLQARVRGHAPDGPVPAGLVHPWGMAGEHVVIVPAAEDAVAVAVMRGDDRGLPHVMAACFCLSPAVFPLPGDMAFEVRSHAPIDGRRVVALVTRNHFRSGSRYFDSRTLDLLRHDGDRLTPVFSAALAIDTSDDTLPPHLGHWQGENEVVLLPAPPGRVPDISIRRAATGREASRHRWDGARYDPSWTVDYPFPWKA